MTYLSIQRPILLSLISSSLIKCRNINTHITQLLKHSSNILYDVTQMTSPIRICVWAGHLERTTGNRKAEPHVNFGEESRGRGYLAKYDPPAGGEQF